MLLDNEGPAHVHN